VEPVDPIIDDPVSEPEPETEEEEPVSEEEPEPEVEEEVVEPVEEDKAEVVPPEPVIVCETAWCKMNNFEQYRMFKFLNDQQRQEPITANLMYLLVAMLLSARAGLHLFRYRNV